MVDYAFVERYTGAHCKDEDCHRKAPEVDLLAVTEREAVAGWFASLAHAMEEQGLVAGIND